MTVKIAVSDPLPLLTDGIRAALTAQGFSAQTPDDLQHWAGQEPDAIIVLTICEDTHWDVLRRLARASHIVIVLLEHDAMPMGVRAIREGARAALPRDVTAPTLVRTVQAALEGQVVMPLAVSRDLITATHALGPTHFSERQEAWIRDLAAGMTVAQVAHTAGYSERAMYRLLKELYSLLGVSSRLEAIMRAKELGLLESRKS